MKFNVANFPLNIASDILSPTPANILLDPAADENIVGSITLEGVATMSFVPQASGEYKVLAWADNGSGTDGEIDAGEKSTTLTITVGGTPSTISITTPSASAATGSTSFTAATSAHPAGGKEGGLVVVRLLDAAGNAIARHGAAGHRAQLRESHHRAGRGAGRCAAARGL